jgi:hypothetical protein
MAFNYDVLMYMTLNHSETKWINGLRGQQDLNGYYGQNHHGNIIISQ